MASHTVTLKLRGMSCASCASTIEDAIRSIPGVETSNVNFGTEQATVTFNPQRTDIGTIQSTVDIVGYTAYPLPDQDLLTEENDAEKSARRLENRDLNRKVWVSGLISAVLVIGSLPASIDAVHSDVAA
jgi:P-type Cu+ transporter